ncbi:VWA domain-containing protein [Mesorhizobium sp. LHD-90]|uniref:vWA domain-containing protein n=1 Tax=Mesorhizobium sp. LHD-90 TaxID=3071414 RepID=UPI0027E01292|nr:VWA domain-containing protein [Mesorhizobium sp. LHD-90]MDQ6433034.1 VWA domain-containing protein [Mesorhizobium sp. LHD-90]
MVDDNELFALRGIEPPKPTGEARARAMQAAMAAFEAEKNSQATQGTAKPLRLTDRAIKLWSGMMHKKLYATPALATLVALPIAGYTAFYLMEDSPLVFTPGQQAGDAPRERKQEVAAGEKKKGDQDEAEHDVLADLTVQPAQPPAAPEPASEAVVAESGADSGARSVVATPKPMAAGRAARDAAADSKLMAQPAPSIAPSDMPAVQEENRDRVQDFETNPIRSVLENPVSTFSIDVDTASYSFVRRSLKEGILPDADSVRVEEMVNYFPYDWKGPDNATTPFNSTVTVMPTPWNGNTKLMHVAIKGYDVKPAEKPKANLVFLLDVSGSMNEPDKLPLLQAAFRLLVNTLGPDDTVSIVTYAGDAGTVLEPTKVSEREKILRSIDTLTPGGSTAGEAGIREAYRLAEQSFVKDGVNRVMLATDGDFNVGQTDDEDLKRIIEEKRKSGVFLSVFGFGRGNLNDQMMQAIAQNGNGTAAYIDTLAEAEKVLVQDASSTIFPIAKDVKIQVEFNPQKVAEYRLIGYETRALKREDFNNDRVDAGEIGSGHSVTAIYEITPKGSPATAMDDLRYGQASVDNGGVANAGEYAFVKIRYKAPDGDVSKLITTPVTDSNAVSSFDTASTDQRFSVAVAAFGQKLRNADQVASFGYDRIIEIATAARGADPFGYRSEFLSLARLAAALDTGNR